MIYKQKKYPSFSLKIILTIPFILLVSITVSIIGYISFKNGQKTIENLVEKLIFETGDRIQEKINYFLQTPYEITQNHQDLIDTKIFTLDDMPQWIPYLWHQYESNKDKYITAIQVTDYKNNYSSAGFNYDRLTGKKQEGVAIANEQTNFTYLQFLGFENYQKNNPLSITYPNFLATKRPWYQEVMKKKRATWINIFPRYIYNKKLALNFSKPLYINGSQEIKGVSSVQLDLLYINQFLESLNISPNAEAFIIEKNGYLVANSLQENPLIIDEKNQPKRRLITES